MFEALGRHECRIQEHEPLADRADFHSNLNADQLWTHCMQDRAINVLELPTESYSMKCSTFSGSMSS